MIYAQNVSSINQDEYDAIYASSEPYLVGGNFGEQCSQNAEGVWCIGENNVPLKQFIAYEYESALASPSDKLRVFELRETGTDHLLSLKFGLVDDDNTFTTMITLMNPNSDGSLSWIYSPPSDADIEALMVPTGIKRIIMTPLGANFIALCENTSIRVNDKADGNRQYRSTWGWTDYVTDLVDY